MKKAAFLLLFLVLNACSTATTPGHPRLSKGDQAFRAVDSVFDCLDIFHGHNCFIGQITNSVFLGEDQHTPTRKSYAHYDYSFYKAPKMVPPKKTFNDY